MNKNVSIYLADDMHPKGVSLLQQNFNVIDLKGLPNNILLNKIKSIAKNNAFKNSALLIRSVRTLDKSFLKSLSLNTDVKLICTISAGFDNIDLDHCKKYKLDVMNVAGANSTSAAEFTFALILAITKNIIRADKDMKNNIFDYSKFSNAELYGKTIGIIGVGKIGSKVAKLAKAFGMAVLGNDINPEVRKRYSSIRFVSLDKILSSSDIVTIHTPLNKTTYKFINEKKLKLLNAKSILINCSRGGTVDEKALIKLLSKNKLHYAAVDVFEDEPSFNKKFVKLKNVILTPHLAGKTVESKERMGIAAAENVIKYYKKSKSKHKLIN
ncbi:MAG: NAD(P)-dependent oxidoreductase [Ignavibacteria bacterium]